MADQPEIPDLKKKEKERKKGGLLWRGAGGGGAPFSGATGGVARSAASAASAIAEAAGDAAMEEGAGWFSRLAQTLLGPVLGPLERLAATFAGKLALAAIAAVLIGGAAMVARMMNASAPAGSAGVASADGSGLGAIASSIKIHTGDASGLDYAARANQGALANQAAPQPAAQKAAEPPKAQDAGKAATADQAPAPAQALDNSAIMANQQRLAHNMSGTQLSSSFGGDFGNHNIFAGANKVGHIAPTDLKAMLNPAANPGKISSTKASAARPVAVGRGRRGFGMSSSLGHLLTMAGMNRTMLSANTQEGAGQTASDQFQSQQTTGGAAPTTPITGAGATPVSGGGASGGGVPSIPGGSGAGSCTNPGEVFDGTSCVAAQTPTAVDVTPWQGMLSSALGMINAAVAMIMMASVLFTAMWITSLMLETNPWTSAIGKALEIAAIVFATAMTAMAMMMGSQIQQLGQSVSGAGSQIIGSGLASLGGMIKSMAWVSITGVGGMILSFMILSKESSILSQVGQQSNAGTTPQSPAPSSGSSSSGP